MERAFSQSLHGTTETRTVQTYPLATELKTCKAQPKKKEGQRKWCGVHHSIIKGRQEAAPAAADEEVARSFVLRDAGISFQSNGLP